MAPRDTPLLGVYIPKFVKISQNLVKFPKIGKISVKIFSVGSYTVIVAPIGGEIWQRGVD